MHAWTSFVGVPLPPFDLQIQEILKDVLASVLY